jgi:hypothetical protein
MVAGEPEAITISRERPDFDVSHPSIPQQTYTHDKRYKSWLTDKKAVLNKYLGTPERSGRSIEIPRVNPTLEQSLSPTDTHTVSFTPYQFSPNVESDPETLSDSDKGNV